jgi:TRAP-type uncharacterized transport system substrate-binding protein
MRSKSPLLSVLLSAGIAVGVLCVIYLLVDPLPPRHFTIATGPAGSSYDNFAKRYQQILARYGVDLEIRNSAGAVENLRLLRDPSSGVQAALTSFGVTTTDDADILYSLGGAFDTPIFVFYRSEQPITLFSQFRGGRFAIGTPGTALRLSMSEVLTATGASNASNVFLDLDSGQAIDALIAGQVEMAAVPQPEAGLLQRLFETPGIKLMNVVQGEAIAKTVPGLKHVILWQGLFDLSRNIPNSNFDMLAIRSRLLVRNELHPALQYLLLEAMRKVHWAPGPFNTLGEFPAEQPNDLPLSPTAQAFYRSGPTLLQRYTSFWLSSLLNRFAFFGIPVLVTLIPLLGFGLSFHRWFYVRRDRSSTRR